MNSRGAASDLRLLLALRRRLRYRPHKCFDWVLLYEYDLIGKNDERRISSATVGPRRGVLPGTALRRRELLHLLRWRAPRLHRRLGPGLDLPVYQPFGVGIRGGRPGELLTDLHSLLYVLSDPDHVYLLRLLPAGV